MGWHPFASQFFVWLQTLVMLPLKFLQWWGVNQKSPSPQSVGCVVYQEEFVSVEFLKILLLQAQNQSPHNPEGTLVDPNHPDHKEAGMVMLKLLKFGF